MLLAIFTTKCFTLGRFLKIPAAILLSLLILLCLSIAAVQTEWGQNWLADKVTARLSKDLRNRISIGHVKWVLFNKMNMEEVLIEDQRQDTLLYAGTVQVNITDWFFFKDTAELEYIGIQDALIQFHRKDSVWNYQFLQDYFASPGSTGNKKAGIQFDLRKVLLQNVAFIQKDAWLGRNLYVKAGSLDLAADEISASDKTIRIKSIDALAPFFHQFDYKGNKPATSNPVVNKAPVNTGLQWNAQNWRFVVDKLNIDNGTFRTDRGSLTPAVSFFDGQHVLFSGINLNADNITWTADTIKANVKLTAKERSGLIVQSLTSTLRLHPQLMELDRLYLKTNRSILRDYFAMQYKSISDLNDFIHKVTMVADFDNSTVSSHDIAFFAPEVKSWNRIVNINGKARGTVDALVGEEVSLRIGLNTSLNGNFSIRGLPNINQTFITVEADELRTNYADAVTFIPAVRRIQTPNLVKLGAIRFSGTYTGFINDFVTYGTLQTALGTLKTDLNMKLTESGVPVYSGSLATERFQLGSFLNSPVIGAVTFTGDLKGKGFNWNTLDLTINGKVKRFEYGNYTYQNITANGRLNNKTFDGNFTINDPNANLKLTGLITLSGPEPVFNMQADIVKANLKSLQLVNEDLSLSGQFDLNFKGRSIGDLLGNANINNATLLHNGKRLSFDSLRVASSYLNGVRQFRAVSNEFDVSVNGQFDMNSLPTAFTLFLNRYYPAYIKPPRRQIPNQAFTFNITTGVVEDYVKLIDSRIGGFNNSRITGSLNVAANSLKLDADVPQFTYNQYQFSDVKLKGDGNFQRLRVEGQVMNAIVTDSLSFPQTTFTLEAQNDISDIVINTVANQTINQANFSAQIRTFANGATILFNPSSFVLNGKTWSIEQGGELDFRKNSVVQGQLILRESNQEINVSTQPSDVGSTNDLHIALKNINLGDFSPFILKSNRIEGLLTGNITVEDPQNKLNVISTIRTDQLRIDNDSIGQVAASLSYNNTTGLLTANGNNADPLHRILFEVAMDVKDSANVFTDRITIQPTQYPVKILERFIGALFSDLQGFVTGRLDILGEGARRDYVGKAKLTGAGLKVNFTQVFYKIDDTEITLTDREINFGRMKLRDRLGRTATMRGAIRHRSFQDMQFDIVAEVDDRPMELLNTNYNDNQQFYGKATGTGSLILSGPQSDIKMDIYVEASERDSSFITLPPSRTRETGAANFMVERKYGKEMTEEDFKGLASNITYEINLIANPLVNIDVILDELTGDVINGRGVGNIRIRAGTSEPLSIRGRYDIQEGSYLFTFQSFFKKPFVLKPESSNYIEWTGDPYSATIKFDAIYKAENVNFSPLISSLSLDRNSRLTRYRGDVNVVALLTGELFKPTFTFKLEFPENSIAQSDPSLSFGVQQIEKNTNEINKQVTYLIVFNSFAPFESGQTGYNPLNEFAYSTISGLFFGEINKRLNQLLSKLLRNNDLTFNFTGALYNRNPISRNTTGFDINQSDFNINVGAPLFNERVQVNFGGTFDVPIRSDIQQNIRLFPDVSVDLLVNKTGTVRATFFYTQTSDLLFGGSQTGTRNQRAGTKLSYRKEFGSIREFFLGQNRRRLKKPLPLAKDSVQKDSATTVANQ